jgi:DNA-binding transcriptional LysR family regulator
MIQAAIEGQGVALGRLPLLSQVIRRQQLITPFEAHGLGGQVTTSPRAFFMFCEPRAAGRTEVRAFCDWLLAQARSETVRAPEESEQAPRRSKSVRRRRRS